MAATETQHTRLWRENYAVLMPPSPNKDVRSRLAFFIDWLSRNGREWTNPGLPLYLDYMLTDRIRIDKRGREKAAPLSPRTAQAHLATIRSRYNDLLHSSEILDDLIDLGDLASPGDDVGKEAEESAQRIFLRLQMDMHPAAAPSSWSKSKTSPIASTCASSPIKSARWCKRPASPHCAACAIRRC